MKTRLDKERAKKAVEKTASKTVQLTFTMVKLVFIIIIFYTVSVTISIFLFSADREKVLIDIATLSTAGFWAFFLGYFGWRLGQSIELYFINLKKNK